MTPTIARRTRARRFPMLMALQYRTEPGPDWVEAFTLDVSRSGALIRQPFRTPLPTGMLDFVLALPPCGIVPTARIRGTGRVVRVRRGRTPAFALAIERYRFVKPDEDARVVRVDV